MGIPNPINKSSIKTALTSVARGLHNNISPNDIQFLVISDVTSPTQDEPM